MKTDLVEIEWLDHANIAGWQRIDNIEDFGIPEMQTIGFLIKENKEALYISSTIGGDEVNATMIVLKSCITKRKVLKKVELTS